MKFETFSYRYASEILQHSNFGSAWQEVTDILTSTPTFVYPGKSAKNKSLDVVQQLINAYFDRFLSIELGWDYHPLATGIEASGLRADFRKTFKSTQEITVQAEIQLGNMARWYSDIFKFQAAYSSNLIQLGLSVVPMQVLARRIDSNIVNFERAVRELPSANLSITLPILLVGLYPDEKEVNVKECGFEKYSAIVGKNRADNRWRIVNGYASGTAMALIGPSSPVGPTLRARQKEEEEEEEEPET